MLLLATDDVIALFGRDDESQSSLYRGNTRTVVLLDIVNADRFRIPVLFELIVICDLDNDFNKYYNGTRQCML